MVADVLDLTATLLDRNLLHSTHEGAVARLAMLETIREYAVERLVGRALDHDLEPWFGDFDGMLERRAVRVLVPYSRTLFYNDKGAQRGWVADALKDFEIWLNRKYKLKNRPITVVAIPTTRELLLPGLRDGSGDMAAGNLTITEERLRRVDFSVPNRRNVVEVVVTGPESPALATLKELAGQEVHVRRSSSYYESLSKYNTRLRAQRKPLPYAVPGRCALAVRLGHRPGEPRGRVAIADVKLSPVLANTFRDRMGV